MKATLFTAVLLTLSVAAFAQSSAPKLKQLPPVEKKSLNLNYLGKDSSSVFERIKTNDADSRFLQQPSVSITSKPDTEPKQQLSSNMPTVQPDTKVHFPILTAKPDTAVHYHMRVKKPN